MLLPETVTVILLSARDRCERKLGCMPVYSTGRSDRRKAGRAAIGERRFWHNRGRRRAKANNRSLQASGNGRVTLALETERALQDERKNRRRGSGHPLPPPKEASPTTRDASCVFIIDDEFSFRPPRPCPCAGSPVLRLLPASVPAPSFPALPSGSRSGAGCCGSARGRCPPGSGGP